MGSIHGTFIKMKLKEQRTLYRGQTYQLGGTDIYLNILDVSLPSKRQKVDSLNECLDPASNSNDLNETMFMQYLGREYSRGTIIHGIPEDSFHVFIKPLASSLDEEE